MIKEHPMPRFVRRFTDLADTTFAQALRSAKIPRDRVLIQSKCGLRDVHTNYHFDFSKDYIISSVEGSLERLQTDYLDVLLLHRPDALVEPEEVAEAFSQLHQAGKVRYFGVSNQNPYQIELLQKSAEQPLIANQLQFGPAHTPMLDAGLNANMLNPLAIVRDGSVLDYCRLHHITIQPWSPFQVDLNQGLFMKHPKYAQLTETLHAFASDYQVSFEALVLAWILRHPAQMQPIVGSMNPQRIRSMVAASLTTMLQRRLLTSCTLLSWMVSPSLRSRPSSSSCLVVLALLPA